MTSHLIALAALLPLFAHAAEPPVPNFRHVTLDDKIQIGYGLAVADVDGDRFPDVLLADRKQFVWYRNPGSQKATDPAAWTKHVMAENLTERDNVCLAAQDIDGDGKCEVAVGGEWNPGDTEKSGAVFYLIAPEDRTQKWTPVKFPEVEPTTHRMGWIELEEMNWGLVVVPLHGRGNKNGEGAPVKVLLYHPPALLNDPKGEWKSELIDESMHATHNFEWSNTAPALWTGGKEGVQLSLYAGGKWTSTRSAMANTRGAGEVRAGLISEKEDPYLTTVSPMHGNELSVWMLPTKALEGDNFGEKPTQLVLTENLSEGHALACGNILGPNADEIVVGWRGSPGKPDSNTGVAVWTSLDDAGENWRETVVDPDGMACEDLKLADLDGDGKLDIVASGRATKNVKIYFNETR